MSRNTADRRDALTWCCSVDPIPVEHGQIHRLVDLVAEPLDEGAHAFPEPRPRRPQPRELRPETVAAARRGRDYQRLRLERGDDAMYRGARQLDATRDLREAQLPGAASRARRTSVARAMTWTPVVFPCSIVDPSRSEPGSVSTEEAS